MPTLKRAALICAPLGSFATSSNLPHAVLQKQNPISGGESAFLLFFKPCSSRWARDICWSEMDEAGAGGPSATAWWQIIIFYVFFCFFYSVGRLDVKQTSQENGIMATTKQWEKKQKKPLQLFCIMSGVLERSFCPWFITKAPPRLLKN